MTNKTSDATPRDAAPHDESAETPPETGRERFASGGEGASVLDAFLPAEPASQTLADGSTGDPESPRPVAVGIRSARLVGVSGRTATVYVRGDDEAIEIALDPDVDAVVIRDAMETGERVMVEADEDGAWVVVGVLRSRQPEKLRLNAAVIEIEADQELVLRSGRSAMRLREDGDVEILGSRISAASRGLFRLVGKMLRLN